MMLKNMGQNGEKIRTTDCEKAGRVAAAMVLRSIMNAMQGRKMTMWWREGRRLNLAINQSCDSDLWHSTIHFSSFYFLHNHGSISQRAFLLLKRWKCSLPCLQYSICSTNYSNNDNREMPSSNQIITQPERRSSLVDIYVVEIRFTVSGYISLWKNAIHSRSPGLATKAIPKFLKTPILTPLGWSTSYLSTSTHFILLVD